jgi:hypothetical protein
MFKKKKMMNLFDVVSLPVFFRNITPSPKQKNKKSCPLANDLSLTGIREGRQNHTQTQDITSLCVLAKFPSGF